MKKLYFLILAMVLFLMFTFGCAKKPVCKEVQVPYTEEVCTNQFKVRETDFPVYLDDPILSNKEGECPDRIGLGIANYGNFRITWEFVNKNNVLLSVPCEIVVRKSSQYTQEVLDEKVVNHVTVNVPAQGTAPLTKDVYLPKCYGTIDIKCKDLSDLPECQPITKYKTKTECS